MIRTLRILLVLFTVCAFMNIFIDDMIFADFDNEELHKMHYGADYNATATIVNAIINDINESTGSGN